MQLVGTCQILIIYIIGILVMYHRKDENGLKKDVMPMEVGN